MKKLVFPTLSIVLLFIGCNYNYKKSSEGMLYKIFDNGSGEKIKQGDFLQIHYIAKLGDSVLFNSFDKVPLFGQYDTSYLGTHDFIDIMHEMRVGDSAVYVRFIDSLVKRGMLQYNTTFKTGETIKGQMKVLAKYASQEQMDAAYKQALDEEKAREIAALEQYATDKKLGTVAKTNNGVLVIIEKEGDGPKADTGMKVNMRYTGYLTNGNKFDSNTDSAFGHVGPFEFVVGRGEVIPGWDEGVKYFKQGGKGKLLIPAMMAYGTQAQGDRLPAYSNLVFDIELMEVKQPEPTPAPQNPVSQ